ncbi:unnamed protein product, partial [Hymenolepis diminuta]
MRKLYNEGGANVLVIIHLRRSDPAAIKLRPKVQNLQIHSATSTMELYMLPPNPE